LFISGFPGVSAHAARARKAFPAAREDNSNVTVGLSAANRQRRVSQRAKDLRFYVREKQENKTQLTDQNHHQFYTLS
jgi:hypothetical protein